MLYYQLDKFSLTTELDGKREAARSKNHDQRKMFRAGTHRVIAPVETLKRVQPLMSAMGITRIANMTGLDRIGIPVVMVCRPNSSSVTVSQGKGVGLDAAKASGLMECVELYHAENILLPLELASAHQLRNTRPIADVKRLPTLSVSRFHEHFKILWIRGHDLISEAATWAPYEMVHTSYELPLPAGSGSFLMSSNGLASGNHPLEAISHAICEVVERDSCTLWKLDESAQARTRIDIDTVDDPHCRALLDRFENAGVAVGVWDITSDIGIPAFYSRIGQRSPDPMRLLPLAAGIGCHPCREIALSRALTEAAQSRLTMIAGSRDDVRVTAYHNSQDLDVHDRFVASLRQNPPQRRFDDTPTFHGETFAADIQWLLKKLATAGIHQVIAVDLTKPELDIPVVRVIIPGLEPLYEVPGYVPGQRARQAMQKASA